MQRQSMIRQILIGGTCGLVLASIYVIGGADPEPVLSAHGIGRLVAGAVGGALVYVAFYRALSRKN
jgi:hypothetical protein